MKPYYASITNPAYLEAKIRVDDALPVMKKNYERFYDVLEHFNAQQKEYYLYFLDGDKWKEKKRWVCNRFVEKYDFQFSYEIFNCPKYKDCVAQWVDEIILISPYRIEHKLDQILRSKEFTMTKLVYKSEHMTMNSIARLSHLVRAKKEIQRGVWYYIKEKDMEVHSSGN